MQYIGIQAQKSSNNKRSLLLLLLFPILILTLVFLFYYILVSFGYDAAYYDVSAFSIAGSMFVDAIPPVLLIVGIWFLIAYFTNTFIIKRATGSKTLDRKENKRIYNLVENLCMAEGMPMPKVNVIDDGSLNAFASGINKKSYTVTLTQGIIDTLDDDELEAVIAHELSHIRNHDVRLLIISIIFVGIFAMVAQMALRSVFYASRGRSSNNKGKGGVILILLIAAALAAVGYFFSMLMRFAISRKREYLADAGAAEMTKNPMALANALRKISGNSEVESIKNADVAQLFIEHASMKANGKRKMGLSSLFATHPPIDKRIKVLEQF